MMEKLKPCPFCGQIKPVRVFSDFELEHNQDGDPFQYTVVCDASTIGGLCGCGGQCGFEKNKEKAIKAWNRRPAPQ
jgi:hypothetical protein